MTNRFGKFTFRGGAAVERRIGQIVTEVAEQVRRAVPQHSPFALVLIGGYGRGEGGIERVNGEERPHNNLDFLLVYDPKQLNPGAKPQLTDSITKLAQEAQVGIDLGFIERNQLRRAGPLVMWYDMRFGHKTILGDVHLVPSMLQFEAHELLPSDVRNLIVNRGSLLLINDLVLEQRSLMEIDRKLVIRHAIKAIIGWGDALLFRWGQYHWSYAAKQKRMRQRDQIPEVFRHSYEAAAEFRFEARYDEYLALDLIDWMRDLREQLGPLHLEFEAWRLRCPTLRWDSYANLAFEYALFERAANPRQTGRKLLNWFRGTGAGPFNTWKARSGFRCSGERERLSVAFPLIVYGGPIPASADAKLTKNRCEPVGSLDLPPLVPRPSDNAEFYGGARAVLGADDREDLRLVYLKKWATHGDTNAAKLLRRLGLLRDAE